MDYNNQDAVYVTNNQKFSIGVIADGCGSGTNSEVGAQLGVRFVSKLIKECIDSKIEWKSILKDKIQSYSKSLAEKHSSNPADFFNNYLLNTIIGFVKHENLITIFHCGDGVIINGGQIKILNQNNRPQYVNKEFIGEPEGDFKFQEFTYSGQTILIGSDGVEVLIKAIQKREICEFSDVNEFLNSELNYSSPIGITT